MMTELFIIQLKVTFCVGAGVRY